MPMFTFIKSSLVVRFLFEEGFVGDGVLTSALVGEAEEGSDGCGGVGGEDGEVL